MTITRKLPRWYAALTVAYEDDSDGLTLLLTFSPEGIPEIGIGGGRVSILGSSDKN